MSELKIKNSFPIYSITISTEFDDSLTLYFDYIPKLEEVIVNIQETDAARQKELKSFKEIDITNVIEDEKRVNKEIIRALKKIGIPELPECFTSISEFSDSYINEKDKLIEDQDFLNLKQASVTISRIWIKKKDK